MILLILGWRRHDGRHGRQVMIYQIGEVVLLVMFQVKLRGSSEGTSDW